MQITWFPSLYDKSTHEILELEWPEVVHRLSTHIRAHSKDKVPCFGPYGLIAFKAPGSPAGASEPQTAVRHDSCVQNLTLAVFDVDMGNAEDVARCDTLLRASHVARLWYTTFSHTADKPSYRILLPLTSPVPSDAWPAFRLGVLRKFAVPADPMKCSGRSHCYFAPSCKPDATPRVLVGDGSFLDVASITPVTEARPKTRWGSTAGFQYTPPAEPTGPVDILAIRSSVMERVRGLQRKGENRKASALVAMLAGEPLAQKGSRNEVTFKCAGILAWALPKASLGTLVSLMRPSVEAMISQGSSLTLDSVERMLETAMRSRAESDHLRNTSRVNMKRELEELRSGLFRAAGLGGGNHGQEGDEAS